MEALAKIAANKIESFKKNEVIMNFVRKEAREKVAAEIRHEMKGGTTALAVELLEIRHPNIKERVENYINAGLFGVFLKSLDVAA